MINPSFKEYLPSYYVSTANPHPSYPTQEGRLKTLGITQKHHAAVVRDMRRIRRQRTCRFSHESGPSQSPNQRFSADVDLRADAVPDAVDALPDPDMRQAV